MVYGVSGPCVCVLAYADDIYPHLNNKNLIIMSYGHGAKMETHRVNLRLRLTVLIEAEKRRKSAGVHTRRRNISEIQIPV